MTPTQEKELNDFIKMMEEQGRAKRTLDAYKERYNMLIRSGKFSKPIHKTGENKIVKRIDEMNHTINTKKALFNLALLLKRELRNEDTEIIKQKLNDINVKIDKENFSKKEKLNEELPTRDELIKKLDKLYDDKKWREYIVNYLIIMMNVRNMDLDVIITRNKNIIDDKDNYLYVKNKSVKYIRNNYKTSAVYGRKEHKITDEKFITSCKEYLGLIRQQRYLLENIKTGERVLRVSKSKYIARIAILTEGKAFKVNVKHFKNDLYQLRKMSERRGTSLETISREYNIDI